MLGLAATRPLVADGAGIPCPFRSLTGVPCPFCGMTRGVVALLHGDIAHAALLNPGSILLVVLAVLLLARWRIEHVTFSVWLPIALVAGLWLFELSKYAMGLPL